MISVIVPVRDEPAIEEFLLRLHEVMSSIPEDYEVLVITSDKEKLHTPIPYLPHQKVYKSYGDSLERAILLGFSVSKGDRLIVLDSDGSHSPEVIPNLLRGLEDHELAVASRFHRKSRFNYPFFRKIVSLFFVKFARLFGSNLTDPMSGCFAVRKDLIENVRFKPFKWKTALEIELKTRPNAHEVPFTFKKRKAGVSKAKILTGLKVLWDVFWEAI